MSEGGYMRKIIGIFICMLLIIPIQLVISKETDQINIYVSPKNICSNGYVPGDYLLTTEWGQGDMYKKYCPRNHSKPGHPRCRLGCWSVAIGQIINYHQLQSEGDVDYYCTYYNIVPQHIVNDLDNHTFYWSKMIPQLNASSTTAEIDNVSRLLYDVATVIQKDFGSFHYKTLGDSFDITQLIIELYDHFDYISWQNEWISSLDVYNITTEIDDNRPLMFYIKNDAPADWHAVVIDGYRWNGTIFEVHLNYGWNNTHKYNDWYDYHGPLPRYDNVTFRKALLIRVAPKPPELIGPDTGVPGVLYNYTVKTYYEFNPPLYYKFDWGDGTFSDWLGRFESGEPCTSSHMWKEKGVYKVRAKARDVDGWESLWSDPLSVIIPRDKAIFNPFLNWLKCHPFLFPLLQKLIQQLGFGL